MALALAGVDAVYIVYCPDLAFPGAADTVGAFADLAVANGVRRLVLLSGRGEEGARQGEVPVENSGADWTIVRCAFFDQNFSETFVDVVRHGVLAIPGGATAEPFLDADVVFAALTDDRHIGQLYESVAPGVRRLVQVIIPFEAVRYPAPPRSARVTWHPAAPSPAQWVEFTVLHCGPVRPRIANASIIGDVTLADGSIVTVIARHAPAQSGAVPLRVEDPGAVLPLLREPNMGALLHGAFPDGCIWFLHLATTPAGTT